jgi:hypothetical protein
MCLWVLRQEPGSVSFLLFWKSTFSESGQRKEDGKLRVKRGLLAFIWFEYQMTYPHMHTWPFVWKDRWKKHCHLLQTVWVSLSRQQQFPMRVKKLIHGWVTVKWDPVIQETGMSSTLSLSLSLLSWVYKWLLVSWITGCKLDTTDMLMQHMFHGRMSTNEIKTCESLSVIYYYWKSVCQSRYASFSLCLLLRSRQEFPFKSREDAQVRDDHHHELGKREIMKMSCKETSQSSWGLYWWECYFTRSSSTIDRNVLKNEGGWCCSLLCQSPFVSLLFHFCIVHRIPGSSSLFSSHPLLC